MKASLSAPVRPLLIAMSAAACLAGGVAHAEDAPVDAVWTAKELRFTYMGFTSRYSCDGLRDKLKAVLLKLGARPDLTVTATGCSGGWGRVSPFPGVNAKLHVLEPVSDKNAPKDGAKPVTARWQNTDLAPTGDPLLAAGDCELTEQIKQRILPLFSARNVAYSSTCIPNQLSVGGTKLTADLLFPAPQSKAP